MSDRVPAQPVRIVVGVDGSDFSKHALAWALGQAERTGGTIEAVCTWVLPTNYGWFDTLPPIDFAADAKTTLHDTVVEVLGATSSVPVTETVLEGHAALVLSERSEHADLVVVGRRGHGEFVGMLIGSVSEYLVAHAHCPVVVVQKP
jgi:nucleotide-binding universal stress UspA family protein